MNVKEYIELMSHDAIEDIMQYYNTAVNTE